MNNGQKSLATTNRSVAVPESPAPPQSGWQPQVLDMVEILKKRWWMVYTSLMLGWILAIAYFFLADTVYQSDSQLLVTRKAPQVASQSNSSGRDSSITDDLLATQMQILQSRKIVSEALNITGLDQLESITSQLDPNETPTDYVVEHLDVTLGGVGAARDAHVLNASFRHSSPDESKQILDAILTHYQTYVSTRYQDVNREAADLIGDARVKLSKELADANLTYKKYVEKAPLLLGGENSTNVHRNRYEQLQAELSLLSIQINEAESRLGVARDVVAQQAISGATDLERLVIIDEKNAERVGILMAVQKGEANTAEFQSRQPERMEFARSEYEGLLKLKTQERELLLNLGNRHPAVENIREQIATTQKFIDDRSSILGVEPTESTTEPKDLQEAYVKLLERDLETLSKRRSELELLAQAEEEEAKKLVKYEFDAEILKGQVDRQNDLYEAVVERLREINLTKNFGGIINDVISKAETGDEIWPNLPICLAFGSLLGLVIGTGRASYAELSNQSFKSAEDVKQTLGLPLLAHVPLMEMQGNPSLDSVIAASGSNIDPSIYAHHLPRSQGAEVFRGLRTSLFFRATGNNVKTIGMTSPGQGDGKSTLLINLAASIAQSGRTVLIVDADLRRPRVGQLLGLSNGEGLPGILESGSEPWDAILPTKIENLSAMPCGVTPENPAELLSRPELHSFLELVRDRFDYVLLDCPPVLAVADPCIVAPLVDATLMVIEASAETSRPDALRALEMLKESGANMIGCCINRSQLGEKANYGDYSNDTYGSEPGQGALQEQAFSQQTR